MTATWNPHTARPDIDPEAYEQHLDAEAAEEAGLLPALVPTPSETLEQLVAIAEQACVQIDANDSGSLTQAIIAGSAWLEAQKSCPKGTWYEWSNDHIARSRKTITRYMLVAEFKDQLADCTGLMEALERIGDLDLSRDQNVLRGTSKYNDALACELHAAGKTYAEIAAAIGAPSRDVARHVVHRDKRRTMLRKAGVARRARRAAEKKALEREQTRKAFKASSLGDVHTKLLALSAALGAANTSELDSRAKRILSQSLSDLYKIEDELKKAIGFEHGS